MVAQVIYVPSGMVTPPAMAGQAGPKPTGPPGTAYVEVVSPRENETSQPPDFDLSIFLQP